MPLPRINRLLAYQRLRPMPLDKVSGTPMFAYALSRLFTAYAGQCVNVRRSSDNATTDIGFDKNGKLDSAALLTHCGAGDGFVVTWYDQSGNGRNATHVTTTKQPKIVSSGVINTLGRDYCVSPDGGDGLQTSSFDLTGVTGATLFVAGTQTGTTSFYTWLEHGAATFSASGGFQLTANLTVSGAFGAGMASGTSNYVFNNCSNPLGTPRDYVGRAVIDTTQSTSANRVKLWLNGAVSNQSTNAASGSGPTSGAFSNQALNLLARANAANNFVTGKCFALIGYPTVMAASDAVIVDKYLCDRIGVPYGIDDASLTFSNFPTNFDFSNANVDTGLYYQSNNFSEVSYTTTATALVVKLYNNIAGTFNARVGVFIDGVYSTELAPTETGESTHGLTLAAGSKTITLRSGLQSRPSSSVIGCYVTGVLANAAITRTTPTLTGGLVLYGDSICSGHISTPITNVSWAAKIRGYAVGSYPVTVESYGFRALHDDAVDGTARAALVTKLAATSPTLIWLAIGTNDYGLNRWSAASFETAYAALLSDLHTALPSATIYAQTPIVRTTEAANGSGSTLGNYRTAISNAASGKGYVTVVDGSAILTTGDLSDGVHPTTSGHNTYATFVKTTLGI